MRTTSLDTTRYTTSINEMYGSRCKIPSNIYIYIYICPYIYEVKFLALLGAPYIYIYIHDISRLRVKYDASHFYIQTIRNTNNAQGTVWSTCHAWKNRDTCSSYRRLGLRIGCRTWLSLSTTLCSQVHCTHTATDSCNMPRILPPNHFKFTERDHPLQPSDDKAQLQP
jgi:hypothetical protein